MNKAENKLNRRINYIQKGLKADRVKNPDRPLKEFRELVDLIGDQFEDMTTFTIKKEV